MTLYESVSKMRPFPEGDVESEVRADQYPQIEYDALPLSEVIAVPREFEQIVMACVARNPSASPSSAIDVAVALERVLEGLGVKELFAWPKGVRVRP